MPAFLVVGCGYAGTRVARRLLSQGERVHVTSRKTALLASVASHGAVAHRLDTGDERSLLDFERLAGELGKDLRVLVSVAPLKRADEIRGLFHALGAQPARVVLLSTTAVYGAQFQVDERTGPAPSDESGRARLEMEQIAASGSWRTLVLRCAGIYGPGRGVHVALRKGRFGHVLDPDRVVSRVHVDDLASLAVAALHSEVEGTWPVADDEPATTREVAALCRTLGLSPLPAAAQLRLGDKTGRRVNGWAVRRLLGVDFKYPSYREGIPASIRGESEPE